MTTTRIRFCVGDDHMVIHDGLRAMAERESDLEFLGGAADAEGLMNLLPAARADILLLDLRFGDDDGIEICREVRRRWPRLLVLFFSAFGDVHLLREGIEAGAAGYLLKDASTSTIPGAIRQVMAEGSYIDPRLASDAIFGSTVGGRGRPRKLSEREREILRLLAHGKVTREIALELSISPHTVKFYVGRMMRDFGARRRAELVRIAYDRDLGR